MVGMKRPYPFSQDNDAPSINFKFPTFVAPPMRTDETTSCGNRGGTYNLDPGCNSIFRFENIHLCDPFISPRPCFLTWFLFAPISEKVLHAQLPLRSPIQRLPLKKMGVLMEIFSHLPLLQVIGHVQAKSSVFLQVI